MVDLRSIYNGCSVLITGGAGFIGSNLARALVALGDVKVLILDSLIPDQGGNLFNLSGIEDQVEFHEVDLRNSAEINHLVSGVDYIFNLAGSVSHLDSMLNPQLDLELNCGAHLSLLEACRHYNPHVKILYSSTRQVYGQPLYVPVDEQHRLAPLDVNGVNKLASERYHQLYHRIYGTRTVCLRLTNTYGPRQLLRHDRQGFLPWFIRCALEGNDLELFGDGKQRRDMNYVDDVVEAMLLTCANEATDGEIYNLGAPEPISVAELAAELVSLTGRGQLRTAPFPAERQLIEIGNFYSSYAKIERAIGWRPRTSIRTGLSLTVDYYLQHGEHYLDSHVHSSSRSN